MSPHRTVGVTKRNKYNYIFYNQMKSDAKIKLKIFHFGLPKHLIIKLPKNKKKSLAQNFQL